MRKQNNFETMWQEEANLWIKQYLIITEYNSCITSQQSFIHRRNTFGNGLFFPEFCAFLRPWVVNTFGQTSCCYYYRQQTKWSQVASRKSDVTRHDDVTISVTRPLCHEDAKRILEETGGGLWWHRDWAQRIHDMLIIKRGAFNEFLHIALIKSTRDN